MKAVYNQVDVAVHGRLTSVMRLCHSDMAVRIHTATTALWV